MMFSRVANHSSTTRNLLMPSEMRKDLINQVTTTDHLQFLRNLPMLPFNDTLDYTVDQWSREVCITTQEISIVVNIVTISVGLMVIIGNLLVLAVLFRYPSKRFKVLNWLLCHLAIADLAIGVTIFWWFGVAELLLIPVTQRSKVVFYGISIVSMIAAFEGLLMIALDRYLLILHHVRYSLMLTRKRLAITVFIMWFVPSLIQIIAPVSGWSCIDLCDCRIHNLRPDDIYCFGESCSQILPPLKKHQLLFASVISLLLFILILVLYILIFRGIRKQSQKCKDAMQLRQVTERYEATTTNFNENVCPFTEEVDMKSSPISLPRSRKQWEEQTGTVTEKRPTKSNSTNMDCSNNALETSDEKIKVILKKGRQAFSRNNAALATIDNATNNVEIIITKKLSYETSVEMYSSKHLPSYPDRQSVEAIEKPNNKPSMNVGTVPDKESQNSNKDSILNVVGALNNLQILSKARRKQRSKATRTRDVKVMKAMFAIMAVFVITTGPLIIFIIYTYVNNNRSLKEIFNYLMQVVTINSLLNPFLYFWRIPAMKAKLCRLVGAHYWQRQWRPRFA